MVATLRGTQRGDKLSTAAALLVLPTIGTMIDRSNSDAYRLALEIHEPHRQCARRFANSFTARADAVEQCLLEEDLRLSKRLGRRELAEFVPTTIEDGVRQARTHRVRRLLQTRGASVADVFRLSRANGSGARPVSRTRKGRKAQDRQQTRSRLMAGINLLVVLVAAMVAFVVGGIWYTPLLFGEGWQTQPRWPEHLRAHKPALIFGLGFLLSLIAALMFAIFLGPHPSMRVVVLTGCGAGMVWVATGLVRNSRSKLSKGRRLELSLINGGFHAVQFMVLGLVFSHFR